MKKKPPSFAGVRPTLILALVLVLQACAHDIPLSTSFDVKPTTTRLPLTMGIYYNPVFLAYIHSESRYGDQWNFPLGSSSVALFNQTLAATFDKIVPVQTVPPATSNIAGVIEPKIDGFSFNLPAIKTGIYSAQIDYRFTLHAPSGGRVASWVVSGEGAKPGRFGFEFARWPGEAADLAMKDAARKFDSSFQNTPEVRVWLRQLGITVAARDPGGI